jgi:predicted permease
VEEIAKRHGIFGLFQLIADIAIRVPIEYAGEMRRDLRYALRSLLKSPGFALVGILSMALSIGLTTNVYTSKWQMLFRKLPAANADRLFVAEKPVSYPYIEQFREQKNLFGGVAALETGVPFNVTFQGNLDGKPQRVTGQLVSPDYFSVLGVQPQFGRALSPALDRSGSEPSVVITDHFWRNRLNSSPGAVGQTLRLNGQLAVIVGIAPRNFNGAIPDPANPPELFVPITVPASLAPELANDVLRQRSARDFMAILCLASGVTPEPAATGLDTITRHLDEQDPSISRNAANAPRTVLLPAGTELPIPKKLRRVVIGFFVVLMALIMIIACMNLANMLLARGANRRKELAIRLSIGASRARLVRQMITEGVLLAVLGAAVALPFAYWLSALYNRSVALTLGANAPASVLDWHAIAFVFALSILCGIGFSLAPALRVTKSGLAPALKEGSALQLPGHRRFGLRNLLMVSQVAASLMLLLIAGFLVTGLNEESKVQTQLDPRTMVLLSVDPVREGYTPERAQAFFERLPDRLKAIPELQSVALAVQPPFAVADEDSAVSLTAEITRGVSRSASRVQVSAIKQSIGAGYFAALSEPVLSGREFEPRDERSPADSSEALPVILSENGARAFFGKESAIGQRIRDDDRSYEVIGVVPNQNNGIGIALPTIYLPLTNRDFARPPAGGITILARGNPGADALPAIRREIASLDPNLTLFNVQTLGEYLDSSRAAERFSIDTYAGIGIFGLVLAAIGLAGITAYAVALRSKEIGIRMALGARKWQVLLQVLREGTALVIAGTILGFAGAYALAKALSALIDVFAQAFKVGTGDPRLIVGAPVLLAAVTLVACYLPARRATQIDPLKALREG